MPRKKQPSIAVKKALEQIPKTEDTQPAYQPISVKLTQSQLDKLKGLLSTSSPTKQELGRRFAYFLGFTRRGQEGLMMALMA